MHSRVRQHDLVHETNGLAVVVVHEHLGMLFREAVTDGVDRHVGVGY